MLIQPIFSSFLAAKTLDVDNDKIISYCLSCNRDSEESDRTTLSGNEPELKQFFDQCVTAFNELHESLELHPELSHKIQKTWINYGDSTRTSDPHYHVTSDFVGVYYALAEEGSGNLNLRNPVSSSEYVFVSDTEHNVVNKFNQFNSQVYSIKPIQGDLVIIPSWLLHYVLPSNGAKRISIAVNSKMDKYKTNTN